MTKQEILAFSLPYELKMCYTYENRIDIHTLLPMHFDCKCQLVNERGKPILRPLSDLTKEIKHKGERFVPLVRLLENSNFNVAQMDLEEIREYESSFKMVELITLHELPLYLQWHFDIAELIEKCEAIDVNTLTENPYK